MNKFKLRTQLVDEIDAVICQEHETWVTEHAPRSLIPYLKIKSEEHDVFSIIKHPYLWSGDRIGETSITEVSKIKKTFQDVLKKAVGQWRRQTKKDAHEDLEVNHFLTTYKQYFAVLKEKTLLMAIKHTTNQFSQVGISQSEDLQALIQFLDKQSFVRMQKREDCLKAHAAITLICHRLRANASFYHDNNKYLVDLTEILNKRLLDIHYKRSQKKTFSEFVIHAISTLSSSTGLLCGIAAVICFGLGFAYPPFWLASAILASIGIVGYIATAISIGNIAYEGLVYQRSPSPKEIRELIIDLIMVPICFFGASMLTGMSHLVHEGKRILRALAYAWNNIGSNLLPSIFYTKDLVDQTISLGKELTTDFEIVNTSAITTYTNIMSQLLLSKKAGDVVKTITQTEEMIKKATLQQLPHTAGGRGMQLPFFAYILLPSPAEPAQREDSALKYVFSAYHDIRVLTKDIIHKKEVETKRVKKTYQDLEKIYQDTDAPISKRIRSLEQLREICNQLNEELTNEKLEKLSQLITEELQSLQSLCEEGSRDAPVVLVSV